MASKRKSPYLSDQGTGCRYKSLCTGRKTKAGICRGLTCKNRPGEAGIVSHDLGFEPLSDEELNQEEEASLPLKFNYNKIILKQFD